MMRRTLALTTVVLLAMAGDALAIGEGAEQRAPMAHAVIGGLITSTILTLFIVPCVYTLLDDLGARITGKRKSPDVVAHEEAVAFGD